MTDATFARALALVLREEGGRVDDKRDPGGRTAFGITQRTFDLWQNAHKLARRDVWTITPAEVSAVYRNAYAAPVRFDDLPAGIGYAVFDDAVNSGTGEAAKELQRAVGVTADGAIGTLTLAAVAKVPPAILIGRLCDARLTFLRRLKAWVTFGPGWSARVAFVREQALAMASSSPTIISAGTIVAPKINTACARIGCALAAKAA